MRYQICARCVMDTSDPNIFFDETGICNHCKLLMDNRERYWLPNKAGEARLRTLIDQIKEAGRGKLYDCIMGLSGGVDSSYLLMKAHEWGLRILAVHVDAGWNSELAAKNIEMMVTKLGIDLHTFVVDWEEMRDLQVAFLRAGVANQDIPQDHAFFAALYRETARHRVEYVLTGSNYATESILPSAWGYSASDLVHLRSIHKMFGKLPLKKFPQLGFLFFNIYLPHIRKIKICSPLDLMPYNKNSAMEELRSKFGWRYYGGKHYESRFTKFFQAYYLPTKFHFDKRRAHIASLVASGEISRDAALVEMQKPLYDPVDLEKDQEFIVKKLGLTQDEFQALLDAPNRDHREYPTNIWMHEILWAPGWRRRIALLVKRLRSRAKSNPSNS